MNTSDWFYAIEGKQQGPIPSTELKKLAAAGKIQPDDLVWREGLTEWTLARNVRGLFDEEPKPAAGTVQPAAVSAPGIVAETQPAAPRPPARRLAAVFLDSIRSSYNEKFILGASTSMQACGRYMLLVAIVLTAVFFIGAAMKSNPLENISASILLILLLAALQYASDKICDSLDRLNRSTAVRLASPIPAEALALLCFVAAMASIFAVAPIVVLTLIYPLILLGIAWFVIFCFLAIVFLNPAAMNAEIAVDGLQPADEAVGLLMFICKGIVKTVPLAFGVGVLAGTVTLGWACGIIFLSDDIALAAVIAAMARTTLITSAALPLVAYAWFLVCCLLFDILANLSTGSLGRGGQP